MGNTSSYKSLILLITISLLSACKEEWPCLIKTSPVKDITSTTAISGGIVISSGSISVTNAGICWGKAINPTTTICDSLVYINSMNYECMMTDLLPGTLYHVRSFAINSHETFYGEDMSFSTLGKDHPLFCYTLGAVLNGLDSYNLPNIKSTFNTKLDLYLDRDSPVLCGAVITDLLPSRVVFEFGPTTDYGKIVEANPSIISYTTNQLIYITSKRLLPEEYLPCSEYHFRIRVENKSGTYYGKDKVVLFHPLLHNYSVALVKNPSNNGATLTGTCYDGYAHPLDPVNIEFEYGPTIAYGLSVKIDQGPITGKFPTLVSASLSGLNAGTVYHYRIKSSSNCGTTYSGDVTFLTIDNAPSCITYNSVVFAESGRCGIASWDSWYRWKYILLQGKVVANDVPCHVSFEYGLTTDYGLSMDAEQNPITVNPDKEIEVTCKILDDKTLRPGDTYHFRVKVTNANGTTYGNDEIFKVPYNRTCSTIEV